LPGKPTPPLREVFFYQIETYGTIVT